ncbi:PREDICTED: BEL1 [Prunus dulcis]|uniref:PREDICTED: BEL1 n=1 Tax=Prunus dulcis TaxID=3755 RepID=A0A5E4FBT6_PRUDU|nr:BEL1-like homeodomain protein 9 [Prunus dulcis]VVA25366.1 PREDICTED: BEL1 [Prunus dulcis]
MAEGFEPYHVPQQSRREKLRVLAGQAHPGCLQPDSPPPPHHHLHPGNCAASGFLPLPYDPSSSFIASSDLLTCEPTPASPVKPEGQVHHHHHHHHPLMGFVSNSSSSSSASTFRNHLNYLDPQPSSINFPINPTSIHDINANPFLYPPQNLQTLRDFDHQADYGHDQVVVFKPEPLSLSLSSSQPPNHHTQQNNNNNNNLQRYGASAVNYSSLNSSVNVASASNENIGSRSSVPLGPFTGYASILKGSRFLKPAQQLLEEFCEVGNREIYTAKVLADSSSFFDPPSIESFSPTHVVDDDDDPLSVGGDGGESRRKKSRLISMLDEVYRRYKQYYQQMQAVVTSFEYVAGLGNAAPYANLAIKAMTRHFKCLKNAITDQLQFRDRDASQLSHGKDESQLLRNTRGFYNQRSIHNSDFVEHQPVWRPQRGLPERAVTVLRAWLFEHFLHPYPTDSDKLMLAKQTGLSRSQVSNWFINARVRLWKPMVEEIHTLETRQAQKTSQRGDQSANRSIDDHLPSPNSLASENPSTTTHRVQDSLSKRTRNELPDHITMGSSADQLNLSCNNLPSHLHVGHVGMNMAGGSSSGVSLTLGLHQNNGIGLSEPFPINAAQRFGLGLDGNNDGYAMGGFDSQNRHFGRDVMGGQLLHDFVG